MYSHVTVRNKSISCKILSKYLLLKWPWSCTSMNEFRGRIDYLGVGSLLSSKIRPTQNNIKWNFDKFIAPKLKKNKWIWNRPINLNRPTAENSSKVVFCACCSAAFSVCNLNDTRALVGLCSLMTLQWGQTRDSWHSQPFTLAHIAIGLSLHIHSFIHQR